MVPVPWHYIRYLRDDSECNEPSALLDFGDPAKADLIRGPTTEHVELKSGMSSSAVDSLYTSLVLIKLLEVMSLSSYAKVAVYMEPV